MIYLTDEDWKRARIKNKNLKNLKAKTQLNILTIILSLGIVKSYVLNIPREREYEFFFYFLNKNQKLVCRSISISERNVRAIQIDPTSINKVLAYIFTTPSILISKD